MDKVILKIQRFNPKTDKQPHFQEYIVEIDPSRTVLDALIEIRNKQDSSLAFRMSCKAAVCGSCALRINGNAKLACKAQIKHELANSKEIQIEPVTNLRPVKDLLVDMSPFYAEMKNIKPWLESMDKKHDKERLISQEKVEKIERTSECIWCGCCYSDCPSKKFAPNYLGPAASVVSHRYIFDERDKRKLERLKRLEEKDIWMCAHCEKSTENCPQNIQVQDVISQLREEMVKNGVKKSDGARHALTFSKSVKKYGELKESTLPIGTFGFLRVIKQVPLAFKLLLKGKLPSFFMKKIKNHKDITKLDKK